MLVEISFSSVGKVVAYDMRSLGIEPIEDEDIAFFRDKICSTVTHSMNYKILLLFTDQSLLRTFLCHLISLFVDILCQLIKAYSWT